MGDNGDVFPGTTTLTQTHPGFKYGACARAGRFPSDSTCAALQSSCVLVARPAAQPTTDVTALSSVPAHLHGHLPASQEVLVQQGLLRRHMGTEQYEWRLALEPRLARRPGLHAEQKIVWPPASAGPRLHCARDNYIISNACRVRLGPARFLVVVGPPVCALQCRRLVSRLTL